MIFGDRGWRYFNVLRFSDETEPNILGYLLLMCVWFCFDVINPTILTNFRFALSNQYDWLVAFTVCRWLLFRRLVLIGDDNFFFSVQARMRLLRHATSFNEDLPWARPFAGSLRSGSAHFSLFHGRDSWVGALSVCRRPVVNLCQNSYCFVAS